MAGILDNSCHELTYVLQYLPYKEDRMMLGLSCKSIYQTIQKNAGSAISTYKSSYASFVSERGYLKCLKYARENGCPLDVVTCASAAKEGHLDCLKYAHENGCPWDKSTCTSAASGGYIYCLKYAHENGCLWDETTCNEAANKGHLECLKYVHENGCAMESRDMLLGSQWRRP